MEVSDSAREIGLIKRYLLLMVVVPSIIVAVAVGFGVRGVVLQGIGNVLVKDFDDFVVEAYGHGGLAYTGRGDAFERLDDQVKVRVVSGSLRAVRVYDPEGLVVYSSVSGEPGRLKPPDRGFERALSGRTTVAVVSAGESGLPGAIGSLMRIEAPVRLDDEVAGVLEIHRPFAPLARSVYLAMLAVVVTVLTGAGATYVLLRYLIGRAERELAKSRERADEVSRRLDGVLMEAESHTLGTLHALTAAVDAKDHYTAQHSLNVTEYACQIGRAMGLGVELLIIERAGLLHDVGKIGVRERVLLKPARLNDAEFEEIKEHSRAGANIIEAIPALHEVVPVILSLHERWDGGGYPDRLSGDDIPLLSRVLAVADAFDAMTTDRPYRPALSIESARTEIEKGAGSQFDPVIVTAFLKALDDGALRVVGNQPRAVVG